MKISLYRTLIMIYKAHIKQEIYSHSNINNIDAPHAIIHTYALSGIKITDPLSMR